VDERLHARVADHEVRGRGVLIEEQARGPRLHRLHDVGRLAIEKALGTKVKTTYVERVKEGPDAERVIQQLAASGHKLIFTTSFGFGNPTVKVAKRNPGVMFEHATGYKRGKNVATYIDRKSVV
jgi:basic membrane lipoprotein Med (substrate-binding protein (PBP1-ABC) superfamily)